MYTSASIISRLSSTSGKNQIHRNVSRSMLSRRANREPQKNIHSRAALNGCRNSSSWVEPSTKVSSKSKQKTTTKVNAGKESVAIERKQPLSTTAALIPTVSNEDLLLSGREVGEKVTVCFDVNLGKIKTRPFDDDLRKEVPNPFAANPSIPNKNGKNDVSSLSNLLDETVSEKEIQTSTKTPSNNHIKNDETKHLTASSISDHISTALQNKKWRSAYKSYKNGVKHRILLDIKTLESLILTAERKDLKEIYHVFKSYKYALKQSESGEKMNIDVLNCVINSLSLPRSSKDINNSDLFDIINGIQSTIKSLDKDPYQHNSLPKFVHAILRQKRNPQISGKTALYHLKYMAWNNFPVDVQSYESILSLSTYRKQVDFDFHRVLRALINQGSFPSPLLVVKIVHNQYPFTNIHNTKSILNSILTLQKNAITNGNGLDYRVDFGTLEYVTYAAARRRSTDLILLVWDLVEMFGYTPSESMYENAIQSFVMSKRQDHNAFKVLADMEQNGFAPSRALISSMNRSIRATERRVDNAMFILKDETTETKISVHSLNCVLSAYASNGLVDKAFETYDNFAEYEIAPNSDSFAYLMESLSVDVNTLIPVKVNEIMATWGNEFDITLDLQLGSDHIEWKTSRLMAADVILLTMEDKGVAKNEHVIHEYIRLLCATAETKKAKDFVTGILDNVEEGLEDDCKISLESFEILSNSLALNGQIESAFEVVDLCHRAGYCNGLPEYAMNRLNQLKAFAQSDLTINN